MSSVVLSSQFHDVKRVAEDFPAKSVRDLSVNQAGRVSRYLFETSQRAVMSAPGGV